MIEDQNLDKLEAISEELGIPSVVSYQLPLYATGDSLSVSKFSRVLGVGIHDGLACIFLLDFPSPPRDEVLFYSVITDHNPIPMRTQCYVGSLEHDGNFHHVFTSRR